MSAALAYASPFDAAYPPLQAEARESRQQQIALGAPWRKPPEDWHRIALARVQKLLALGVGWDGHTGRKLAISTAYFALDVLEQVMLPGVPMPSLMPLSNGGLQIEWHRKGWDVEIEVARPNRLHLWAFDIANDREYEVEVSEDIAPLFEFVTRIAG